MKTLIHKSGLFAIALTVIFVFASLLTNATTYYTSGNGIPSSTASWWTNTNGSGSHPAGFTNAADIFIIQNGHNMATTTDWTVAGNVTIQSGGILTVNSGNTDISFGSFIINNGGSATIFRDLTVGGTTSISGTINFGSTSSSQRTATFTGLVTLNSGTIWNETTTGTASDFQFGGGLINNATTFTAQSPVHIFSGSGATLSGSTVTSIPNVTISGTTTNTGTLTVTSALAGSSTLTNSGTGTLNLGGTITLTTLSATASGNTVNYTGGTQTVKVTAYSNLGLSGTGTSTKTFGAGITIASSLSINTTAIASLGNNNFSVPTLNLNGVGQLAGTYGSTAGANPATNKIASAFGTTGNGILTVTVGSCISPSAYAVTGGGGYCSGGTGAAIGLSNSQSGINYQLFQGVNPVGSPVPGTGAAISFGNQATVGTYTAVATNPAGGCTTNMTGNATVSVNSIPLAAVNGSTNVLCNGNSDGTITVTASGGLAPYRYAASTDGINFTWITPSPDPNTNPYTIMGLSANQPYRIKVQDSNNCISK